MAANTRDEGPEEDPLSRQLREFFLNNIIPAVADTARREAITEADKYIADVRRESDETRQAMAARIGEIDRRNATLQNHSDKLSSLAVTLAEAFEQQRADVASRLNKIEQDSSRQLTDLITKANLAMGELTRRRDELHAAAVKLQELHRNLQEENRLLTVKALEIAAAANAAKTAQPAAAAQAEVATPVPNAPAPAEPATGAASIPSTKATAAGGGSVPRWRRAWHWSRRHLWWIVGGAVAVLLVLLLYVFADRVPGRNNAKTDPPAKVAGEDSRQDEVVRRRADSIARAWVELLATDQTVLPHCKEAGSCQTFEDAWSASAAEPAASQGQVRVLQAILRQYTTKKGCPQGLATIGVDGEFGPGTVDAANRIAVECLKVPALPAMGPTVYDAEGIAEEALVQIAPALAG